jgi:tripartite-type tricarboxylate transporter receptor subunit TctC
MRYHHKFMLGMFAFLTAIGSAWAQQYPDRAIKWIVPYPPAGTTDVIARIIAPPLSEILGQQVIVENRPGGGNNIGVDAVVKSPPDGYTMLLVNPGSMQPSIKICRLTSSAILRRLQGLYVLLM